MLVGKTFGNTAGTSSMERAGQIVASPASGRKRRCCFVLAAVMLLAAGSVMGQAVFGNIAGTIQDASGAAVANANVTITDLGRGTVYTVQSGSEGNYYRLTCWRDRIELP